MGQPRHTREIQEYPMVIEGYLGETQGRTRQLFKRLRHALGDLTKESPNQTCTYRVLSARSNKISDTLLEMNILNNKSNVTSIENGIWNVTYRMFHWSDVSFGSVSMYRIVLPCSSYHRHGARGSQ